MKVLSLFNGISCGRVALERVNIPVERYVSFEIDKYANMVAQSNYPNDEYYGDVTTADFTQFKGFDLLIGGSPCQGFSIAGKQLNFNDPRSKLFFEFVRAFKETKPKYFLLENVASMNNKIVKCIDKLLDCNHYFIDGVNFTGMHSKRLYWTNIPMKDIPTKNDVNILSRLDKNIFDIDLSFLLSKTIYCPTISRDGIITINPKQNSGKQTWQRGRVYDIKGKLPRACASLFDMLITKDHKTCRKLTINELESFFGLKKDYTKGIPYTHRGKCIGNGWTVDVIAHIFKGLKNTRR